MALLHKYHVARCYSIQTSNWMVIGSTPIGRTQISPACVTDRITHHSIYLPGLKHNNTFIPLTERVHFWLNPFSTDGTVTLPQQSNTYQQGRTYTINCQITGETFVGWQTPAKPPRSGRPAIPSETITLSTTGRREVAQVGDNYGLKIKDFTVDDGGVYTCVGSSQSASFTANVDSKCLGKKDI